MVTTFSRGLRSCSLPKRMWNGVERREPSSCSTTMMSIAPESVEGLMSIAREARSCRMVIESMRSDIAAAAWGEEDAVRRST